MIEKILERLEERKSRYEDLANEDNFNGDYEGERKYTAKVEMCEELIEIVQEVAKEYGNASDNDLTVVSALPSLYPLQPFEEEAIHKVIASAKDGGWIPCSERLPDTDENKKYLVCGAKGGIYIAEFVCKSYSNNSIGPWWSASGRYAPEPIAWMELPAPYQKGE